MWSSKYNIKKEVINPANPTCNCYSVAKAFSVTAIGLLYDKGLVKPNTLLVDILRKYYPSNIDTKWMKVTIHDVLLHKFWFETNNKKFELSSKGMCFDYIYILGLTQNEDLANYVMEKDVFTDLMFKRE